jgi:chromosomal replication initiator protein
MTLPATMINDGHSLWGECLERLKQQIQIRSYRTWLEKTSAEVVGDRHLHVYVTSEVAADWLRMHYMDKIAQAVHEVVGELYDITVVVRPDQDVPAGSQREPEVLRRKHKPDHGGGLTEPVSSVLNDAYSFASFVVGDENRLARAAAYEVANGLGGTQFNPLFIFGKPGMGKTHLLNAIGNHVSAQGSGSRVLYTTAEEFMQDFITSLRVNETGSFKNRYRGQDLLLVDDFQFLLRGEHTQVEFFHTFNQLHQNGRQIVIACDRAPEQLIGAEDRLISRLQWGLTVCIEPPKLQTRIAILKYKALSRGMMLSDDVASYVANFAQKSVREIEGALNALMAHCVIANVDVSIGVAEQVLRRRGSIGTGVREIYAIQNAVANHYRISVEAMVGRSRKRETVRARQVAMYIVRKRTSESYSSIGECFGTRDHSTVIHAIRCVERFIVTDQELEQIVDKITTDVMTDSDISTYARK